MAIYLNVAGLSNLVVNALRMLPLYDVISLVRIYQYLMIM